MAYDEMLLSLHEQQRSGTAMAGMLDGVYTQVLDISGSIGDMDNVPADVKADFTSFHEAFDEVRVKFGVPLPAAVAGGADPATVGAATRPTCWLESPASRVASAPSGRRPAAHS